MRLQDIRRNAPFFAVVFAIMLTAMALIVALASLFVRR
jgi:hypothetical protein